MTELYKFARPLLKGVPAHIENGQLVDNERQPIPNKMMRDMLGGLPQFYGEIVVGNPVAPDCYERTLEVVTDGQFMSLFVFWVYDIRTTMLYPLQDRLKIAEPMIAACSPVIQWVDHALIESPQELEEYTEQVVKKDFFPGIVLREPHGTFGTEDDVIEAVANPN